MADKDFVVKNNIVVGKSNGDEGGQIDFIKAATNTTLTTGVSVDVYQNRFRIFETGGTARGYYLDISSGAATAGSLILTSATAVTAAQGGTGQTTYTVGDLLYASATTTLSKLGIGTAGQVLTVNGTANGFTWTSPLTNPMTTLGDIIYGGASGAATRLAGNSATQPSFLSSTGTGSAAQAPAWTSSTGSGNVVLAFSPTITAGASSSVGLIVKGAASQTANLQDWKDSSGSTLAAVNASGILYLTQVSNLSSGSNSTLGLASTGATISSGVAGNVVLKIQNTNASPTGNLTEWRSTGGSIWASVSNDARFVIGGSSQSPLGTLTVVAASAGQVATVIRGATSQTGNLLEAQESGGQIRTYIDSIGKLRVRSSDSSGASLVVGPTSTSQIPIVAQGIASQTASLQEWQNSTPTTLVKVEASGLFTALSGINVNNDQNAANSPLWVRNNQSAVTVAVIKGASGQTNNLTEWQNSGGTTLALINASGKFGIRTAVLGTASLSVAPDSASGQIAVLRAATSQTGNFLEMQGSDGTRWTTFDQYGQLIVGGSDQAALGSLTVITPSASTKGVVVRGKASQTENLQEWQTSAGTVVGGINALAQVFTGSTTTLTKATGGATTAASGTGTTATITTTSAHGLNAGDIVTIAGVTPTGYNGTYILTSVTSNTISYANTTTGAQTVAGTVSAPAQMSITGRSGGVVALAVKSSGEPAAIQTWTNSAGTEVASVNTSGTGTFNGGVSAGGYAGGSVRLSVLANSSTVIGAVVKGAASQSANLQEWRNSSDTVLAKVDASGNFTAVNGVFTGTLSSSRFSVNGAGFTYISYPSAANGAAQTILSLGGGTDATLGAVNFNFGTYPSATGTSRYGYLDVTDNSNYRDIVVHRTGQGKLGVGETAPAAKLHVTADAAGVIGTIVKGASGQTANLQEWQDSGSTVLAKVDKNGNATFQASVDGASSTFNAFETPATLNVGVSGGSKTINIGTASASPGSITRTINFGSKNITSYTSPSVYEVGAMSTFNFYGTVKGMGGGYYTNSPSTSGYGFDIPAQSWAMNLGFGSATRAAGTISSFGIPTFDISSNTGSQTITDAANVYIAGAPVAGTGVTLTNTYALWVASGASKFDGSIVGTSEARFDNTVRMNGGGYWSGALNVQTAGTATYGIVVRGRVSQTGDLQRWETSDASPKVRITSTGSLTAISGIVSNATIQLLNAGTGDSPYLETSSSDGYRLRIYSKTANGGNVIDSVDSSPNDFLFSGTQKIRFNSNANIIIGGTTAATSATNSVHMYNATAPSANITNGGVLYVESGALKFRGSGGGVNTIAGATAGDTVLASAVIDGGSA